ncbi:MAG: hypothetical protein RR906_00415 [Acetivibrio sp.]
MKLLLFWTLVLMMGGGFYGIWEYGITKRQQKEKDRIFYEERKTYGTQIYGRYLFFSKWFFTRHSIRKLKQRMDIYFPGNEKKAAAKTLSIFQAGCGSGALAIFFLLLIRPNWILSFILLSSIYFTNSSLMMYIIEKETMEMLEEFLNFLSEMRHAFQRNPILEECLEQTRDMREYGSLNAHITYLLEILEEEDTTEQIKEYMDAVPNPFLKEFFMLCVTVHGFGDPKGKEGSLFLNSLQNLKQSVTTDILRRKKQKHLFGGYSFIIALPILTLPLISMWALHTMPVLTKFYHGSFGILYPLFSFLVTWVCYQLNLYMQEEVFFWERENAISYFLCENPFLFRVLRKRVHKNQRKSLGLKNLLSSVGDTRSLYQLELQRVGTGFFLLLFSIAVSATLPGDFKWYYFLFFTALTVGGYEYPRALLLFKEYWMKNGRREEVMQFQSVIYILSAIPRMTREILLGWLFQFSYIFRDNIAKCIEGEETTEEGYPPLKQLLENLENCDKVGMEKAFDELEMEHQYFQEEKKQEGEIDLDNKAAMGNFLSMVPTVTVVMGYLFAPFIVESFTQLFTQFEQIKNIF